MSHQAEHLTWFVDVSTIPQPRYYGILQKCWKPTYCHISSGKWMGMIHQSFIISRDLSIFKRFVHIILRLWTLYGPAGNLSKYSQQQEHMFASRQERRRNAVLERLQEVRIPQDCNTLPKQWGGYWQVCQKMVIAPKQWMVLKDWWLYYICIYCI